MEKKWNNFFDVIPDIKNHYEILTPGILKSGEINPAKWNDPYCNIPWEGLYSPI